jgi:hypothetical protein
MDINASTPLVSWSLAKSVTSAVVGVRSGDLQMETGFSPYQLASTPVWNASEVAARNITGGCTHATCSAAMKIWLVSRLQSSAWLWTTCLRYGQTGLQEPTGRSVSVGALKSMSAACTSCMSQLLVSAEPCSSTQKLHVSAACARAVDDLMRMVSGIDWNEAAAVDASKGVPANTVGEMLYEAQDAAAFVGGLPQNATPGMYFNYSTGNYQVVQYNLRWD